MKPLIVGAGFDRRHDRAARTDYINQWREKTWAEFYLLCNRRLHFGRRTIVSAHRSNHDTALTPVLKPARPRQQCDAGAVLNLRSVAWDKGRSIY
jgi:hypothetical protein